MFRIRVELEGDEMTGLEALDFRRSRRLKDETSLGVASEDDYVSVEVDEGFARLWFAPNETVSLVEISIHDLSAGDLVDVEGRSHLVGFAKLSPERARDLFVAARFKALKK